MNDGQSHEEDDSGFREYREQAGLKTAPQTSTCIRCRYPIGGLRINSRCPGCATRIRPAPTERVGSLGGKATSGFTFLFAQTLLGKAVSLAGNIILARLLLPEHFGAISITLIIFTLLSIVQQNWLKDLLVRRQARLSLWANPAYWMASAHGFAAALIMAAASPVLGNAFGQPDLAYPLAAFSIVHALRGLTVVSEARLQIELRFGWLALVESIQSSGRMLMWIGLAAAGLGLWSFVLSYIVAIAVRGAVLLALRPPKPRRSPQLRRWKYLYGDLSLLTANAVPVLINAQSDKLLLGLLAPPTQLGLYFWSYQICIQPIMLLGSNLVSVLFPTLTKLSNDPARQLNAFTRSTRTIASLVIPACFVQAALAAPLVRALFDEQWLGAITVMQIISFGFALKCLGWPASSLLTAQGRFRTLAILSWVAAGLSTAGAAAGAILAPAGSEHIGVAIGVVAYLAIAEPMQLIAALSPYGNPWAAAAKIAATPLAVAIFTGLAAWAAVLLPTNDWGVLACGGTFAAAAFAIAMRLIQRDIWSDLIQRAMAPMPQPIARFGERLC